MDGFAVHVTELTLLTTLCSLGMSKFSPVEEVAGSQVTNTVGSFGQINGALWNNYHFNNTHHLECQASYFQTTENGRQTTVKVICHFLVCLEQLIFCGLRGNHQ